MCCLFHVSIVMPLRSFKNRSNRNLSFRPQRLDVDSSILSPKQNTTNDDPETISLLHVDALYNTIELLLNCGLVRKHQFGMNQSHYEKSYFDKQHDHVILTDSGEVKEFCDPRIQTIKKTIEDVFDIKIHSHSLYFYGSKKNQ